MKKTIALVLAILSMGLIFAGCGSSSDSDYDYIIKNKKMIVGITNFEPMNYKDENGNWTGFDTEFAQLVGKELGVEVEFIEIEWDNKFFELESKSIDCIWNGMTITEEATLNSSVSDPYVENAQVVVMSSQNAAKYKDEASMANLSFAAEAGSAGEASIADRGWKNYTAVGTQADALMEVAAGSADACVIDLTMANAMTGEGTSYSNLTQTLKLDVEQYGIAFRKESDMTKKVNEIIADLIADGTLDALAAKYSLTLVK